MKQSRYESAVWPYSSDTPWSTSYCMKFQDLKSTPWARIEPHHSDWQHYDWPLHYRDSYWRFPRFSSNSSFFFGSGRNLKVPPFQARIDPNYLDWQHSGVTTTPPWLLLRAFFFLLVTLSFRHRKNLKVLTTQKEIDPTASTCNTLPWPVHHRDYWRTAYFFYPGSNRSQTPRLTTLCCDHYTTVIIANNSYFFF